MARATLEPLLAPPDRRCPRCADAKLVERIQKRLRDTRECGAPRPPATVVHRAFVEEFGAARCGHVNSFKRHLDQHEPLWSEPWPDG